MTLLSSAPTFSEQQAIEIANKCYGLDATCHKVLPSERDQNFLLKHPNGLHVLKISNQDEEVSRLEAHNQMMSLVAAGEGSLCPNVVPNLNGEMISRWECENGNWSVRLVEFLTGTPMADHSYLPPSFYEHLGETAGEFCNRLEGFDHQSLHYDFRWDLKSALNVIETNSAQIQDDDLRSIVENITKDFQEKILPITQSLPSSVVHNDMNDGNVIVKKTKTKFPATFSVGGVIDFGDAIYGWTISELAIAISYAILDQPDPLEIIQQMVTGYCKRRQLTEAEAECLFSLVCMRLCQSASIAAKQSAEQPDNEYLNVSQGGIANTLPILAAIPMEVATWVIRNAAKGLSPSASENQTEQLTSWLQENQEQFHVPVTVSGVPKLEDVLVPLDLSVESDLVPANMEEFSNKQLQERIERFIDSKDGKVGVGGYMEPRLVYQGDHYKTGTANQTLTAPRTVHLGVDFFVGEGTTVHSIFQGEVVVCQRVTRDKDYGNLIVLKHSTEAGTDFYSLYGHLSNSSITKWSVGQKVGTGVPIGKIGHEKENGGWPPHLHFQLLTHFHPGKNPPGVCTARWAEAWSQFNLDPNLIFGFSEETLPPQKTSWSESAGLRAKHMGGSLSLGYDRPLKMVRGWKHFLFDHTGRRYLDSFNNVPHVGHANPRVVEAMSRQASLLNTNTRYLNDTTLRYTQELAETMPDGLEVVFLVNSASEANELALRMTRAATGSKNMVVLEAGYHGNTTSLIDISPYKHEGPGGQGAPDWVHKVDIADVYRGEHRDPETAGVNYAKQLDKVIEQLHQRGEKLGGYIAESCPSVGGQVLFPKNYLKEVYQRVRAAGGVCIADEVQTGFGRLGSHFYGFQMQNVSPDIVILGKPIGNGHPLAALITTKEIADAFNNGMEYFSTFGGNMVSCAVGSAVLSEIKEQSLQENAHTVGQYLIEQLQPFTEKYEFVGDVRGSGFFLGVELVRDRETLEPADKEASFVSNRMKDRGILLGTDGPYHNVIKIRPPMTFTKQDADRLVKGLGECFEELKAVI